MTEGIGAENASNTLHGHRTVRSKPSSLRPQENRQSQLCPTNSRLKATPTQHNTDDVNGPTDWATTCATSQRRRQGRSQTSSYKCAKYNHDTWTSRVDWCRKLFQYPARAPHPSLPPQENLQSQHGPMNSLFIETSRLKATTTQHNHCAA
jgi:hypothetical protein